MERTTAVPFAGTSRIHLGLEVADLERSIAFYSLLFGEQPVKRRPGYAKFEPAEPSVNLSLNAGPGGRFGRPGGDQHFGVQVRSSGDVQRMTERFRAAGVATRVEEQTACCYAVQDKVWVEDPDGNPWEVFVVTDAESSQRAPTASTCCVPEPADQVTAASSCCAQEPVSTSATGSGGCCSS